MHTDAMTRWEHDHVFGQDERRAGERRTLLVVILTAVMMVVEVAAGAVYGSMALLADGLHMASHATALGIAVFAYVISRRLAADRRFSFGVGKINSLAGFASAVLLLGFALVMATESADRFVHPVVIGFDQALLVAFVGLVVNGASAWIRASSQVLLDHQADEGALADLRESIEAGTTDRVADLHVWSIGPGMLAAEIAVVSHEPGPPDAYKARIPNALNVVHATVEVHSCPEDVPQDERRRA
ncbi:MAG: cation diffusion facilitator family transporter [Gammaproteobacteria bacterium]